MKVASITATAIIHGLMGLTFLTKEFTNSVSYHLDRQRTVLLE
jgi:hypothetical protein